MPMQHNPSTPKARAKQCHNCREGRRKCDKSVPACLKCQSLGQVCRGYEDLLKWTNSVASRGKLSGKTYNAPAISSVPHTALLPQAHDATDAVHSPTDSDASNGTGSTDFYISYYSENVCKDMVLHDDERNAFRALIPVSRSNPMLQHIIVAIAALHYANASGLKEGRQRDGSSTRAYNDALVNKQNALEMLSAGVAGKIDTNQDVLLASIMLFVLFELLDSGNNEWRFHTEGAKQMLAYFRDNAKAGSCAGDLRSSLMANCVVYDVLGTTLTRPAGDLHSIFDSVMVNEDELANTCLSCPPMLLQIIRDVSYCSRGADMERLSVKDCDRLLSVTKAFDVESWVASLQRMSEKFDHAKRVHIGTAYKSAVSIYVLRATVPHPRTAVAFEDYASDIMDHLRFIPGDDWFFKATCWPTFMAGAETNIAGSRYVVVERFKTGMLNLPWGYLANALDVLRKIWSQRDEGHGGMDWLAGLKSSETDILIA